MNSEQKMRLEILALHKKKLQLQIEILTTKLKEMKRGWQSFEDRYLNRKQSAR